MIDLSGKNQVRSVHFLLDSSSQYSIVHLLCCLFEVSKGLESLVDFQLKVIQFHVKNPSLFQDFFREGKTDGVHGINLM